MEASKTTPTTIMDNPTNPDYISLACDGEEENINNSSLAHSVTVVELTPAWLSFGSRNFAAADERDERNERSGPPS